MSQQIIYLGSGPDTQTGDSLYVAFTKVNDNFAELYSVFDGNGITQINANVIFANNIALTSNLRAGNVFTYGNIESVGYIVASGVFYPNGRPMISETQIDSDILPVESNVFTIGNSTNQFTTAYLSSSIVLAGKNLTVNNGVLLLDGVAVGNYSNANVAAFLPTYNGSLDSLTSITTTGDATIGGNVIATTFVGNFSGNITGNITAAGSNTQILFNDQGSVAGDPDLTYDKETNVLTSGNLNVGPNIFIVNGQRVGINTSNLIDGATFQINSTDSILLPTGTSIDRPANAQPGMLRFNTLLSDIEYFTGESWAQPITQFTISVANAQPGTGSQTSYTLPVANATTAGTIVSINGIVQQPITAYSITGNIVTFTEAPSPEDIIDFRIITTSSTLTGITDVYGTTGLYLDQTSPGDQIITFKNADKDTVLIEANGQVRITSNIEVLSQDYRNGTLVVDGSAGFAGNVSVNGILYGFAKNFLIDHPLDSNYKLQYSSLEGPEYGVYIRGRLKGSGVIALPDYWKELVDENSITVTLTPTKYYQELYVADIKNNTVYVANSSDNEIHCFYTVWAERKDLDKLEVEYRK